MDLFQHHGQRESERQAPLAHRMRPASLDDLVGQQHILGPGTPLGEALRTGEPFSIILWGPPGTGKSSLARLLAGAWDGDFEALSATQSGVREVRAAVERAAARRLLGRRTILFIDEIHRFNKAQQDHLLPHVEGGAVVLVGATTENPSFEVIGPLLSRTRVLRLAPLAPADLGLILRRALADSERGLGGLKLAAEPAALERIAAWGRGDARAALGLLERAAHLAAGSGGVLDEAAVERAAGDDWILYDRAGDEHYDAASALIKSMRGSDPDAALAWLAKMVAAGEDPRFIMRRVMICASEDVGNADPLALLLSVAAAQACERVGLPEAQIIMAQAVTYVAAAPKSNAAVLAIGRALEAVRGAESLRVPPHLKGSSFSLAREFGIGEGYRYPHAYPGGFVRQDYFPEGFEPRRFYAPGLHGREVRIRDRLRELWPERWEDERR